MIGKLLNETYRIEGIIGRGAMGVVYEARHRRLGRRLALKLLLGSLAEKQDSRERFRREARIASQLVHPNIVEVVDYNITEEGLPYLVMELLDGELLGERLARLGRLELPQAASILRQLTSALAVAHDSGIVHRDLKPGNIVLCRHDERDDYVKVLDFGISKVVGALHQITRAKATMGTPRYMAPEQAAGDTARVDRRADIYAVGAILYEMLGGEPLVSGANLPDVIYRVVNEAPAPLSVHAPALPAGVVAAVHRALAKRPSERFGTMRELWEAFYAGATATGEISLEMLSLDASDGSVDSSADRSAQTLDLGAPSGGYPVRAIEATTPLATPGDGEPTAALTTAADDTIAEPRPPELAGSSPLTELAPGPYRTRSRRTLVLLCASGVAVLAAAATIVVLLGRSPDSPPPPLPDGPRAGAAPPLAAPLGDAGQGSGDDARARDARIASAADAAGRGTRRLSVSSRPPGARVQIDGQALGTTPLTGVAIAAEGCELALLHKGYRRWTRRLAPGHGPLTLAVSMTPTHRRRRPAAILQVMTLAGGRPLWANAYLDGRAVGQTPLRIKVSAGAHTLVVRRAGYGERRRHLRLRAGQQLAVRLTLR